MLGIEGDSMRTKVLVRAPVLTRSGYGEHSRFVLRSLRTKEENLDIYILPVNWGECGWIYEDDEERRWLDSLIQKTSVYQQQGGQYDVSLQVTIPNEWERMAPANIGITAGVETTKTAPIWLEKANMMDKIITISEFSKNVFMDTVYDAVHKHTGQKLQLTCEKPIEVVHYPVKQHDDVDLNLKLKTDFNFLTVAQWGPRKNVSNTIKWFVEEFIDNPEVGLILKVFYKGNSVMDREVLENKVKSLLQPYNNRECKIYLLHGDMNEQEIHSLYKHPKIKAFVSLAHGEGFGLPHFEAAYSGLPVVAPEWSGYMDFLCKPTKNKRGNIKNKPHFVTVHYTLQNIQPEVVWDGVLVPDSMWAYADQGSYKMRLREVYKDHKKFKKQAKTLQKWILTEFEEQKQYEKMYEALGIDEQFDVENWLDGLDVQVTE
mgnify:CR=1 FL=1